MRTILGNLFCMAVLVAIFVAGWYLCRDFGPGSED